MLGYGISIDCIDEYLNIGESTSLQCLKKFAEGVIAIFGEEYLRKLAQADVDRLLAVGNERSLTVLQCSMSCIKIVLQNASTSSMVTSTESNTFFRIVFIRNG